MTKMDGKVSNSSYRKTTDLSTLGIQGTGTNRRMMFKNTHESSSNDKNMLEAIGAQAPGKSVTELMMEQ